MQTTRIRATWAFQALADETRFRIVRLLATFKRPVTPGQIAIALGKIPSHLSRHLQILEIAEMITVTICGQKHQIELSKNDSTLEGLYTTVVAVDDIEGMFAGDLTRLRNNLKTNVSKKPKSDRKKTLPVMSEIHI